MGRLVRPQADCLPHALHARSWGPAGGMLSPSSICLMSAGIALLCVLTAAVDLGSNGSISEFHLSAAVAAAPTVPLSSFLEGHLGQARSGAAVHRGGMPGSQQHR